MNSRDAFVVKRTYTSNLSNMLGTSGFQIYDVANQQSSDLPKPEEGALMNWAHSPDYKYFDYTAGSEDPTIYRIRMADL